MQIAVESDLKFWIEAFESQYIWQFIFALKSKEAFWCKRVQFSRIGATYAKEVVALSAAAQ